MKKLKHIKLFESFETVEKLDIDDILSQMPSSSLSWVLTPALRTILKAINESGAPLKLEMDKATRSDYLWRISIENANNGYRLSFQKDITGLGSDPAALEIRFSNGTKTEKVFYASIGQWKYNSGVNVARQMARGSYSGATTYWPDMGGMPGPWKYTDGTSISETLKGDIFASSKTANQVWKRFGEAYVEHHKDKDSYLAIKGLRVYSPDNMKNVDGADLVELNKALPALIMSHPHWETFTSEMSDLQADQKMQDKLADSKTPLKDRLKGVIKYTKPLPDETLQRGNSNPWATTSTDKKRNVYDLGMMEDSPAEIQKTFDTITDQEWQKLASEVFGGYLMSIKVNKVYIQDSDKAKSETPNLFNQNKLQLVIEYDSTIYHN